MFASLVSPLLLPHTPFEDTELSTEHFPSALCKPWWSQTFFPIASKYFGSEWQRKDVCYDMRPGHMILWRTERGFGEPKSTSTITLKPLMKRVTLIHCEWKTGLTRFPVAFSVVFDIKDIKDIKDTMTFLSSPTSTFTGKL